MEQRIYQIDAFSERMFSGNPAAVCPLDKWLTDEVMQNIAMENNLAETAFYVKQGSSYEIRWFTPEVEVDLCGHATLAAAYVLFNYENHQDDVINFISPRSGNLTIRKEGDMILMNFPTDILNEIPLSDALTEGLSIKPIRAFRGKTDFMLIYEKEDDVKAIVPDFDKIKKVGGRGIIVTAKGNEVDFVSRFFAPQVGVNEDPVTGSAHTTLTPYWSKELGKTKMSAIQLSKRKGYLNCKYLGERVEISGQCSLYLKGEIFL